MLQVKSNGTVSNLLFISKMFLQHIQSRVILDSQTHTHTNTRRKHEEGRVIVKLLQSTATAIASAVKVAASG